MHRRLAVLDPMLTPIGGTEEIVMARTLSGASPTSGDGTVSGALRRTGSMAALLLGGAAALDAPSPGGGGAPMGRRGSRRLQGGGAGAGVQTGTVPGPPAVQPRPSAPSVPQAGEGVGQGLQLQVGGEGAGADDGAVAAVGTRGKGRGEGGGPSSWSALSPGKGPTSVVTDVSSVTLGTDGPMETQGGAVSGGGGGELGDGGAGIGALVAQSLASGEGGEGVFPRRLSTRKQVRYLEPVPARTMALCYAYYSFHMRHRNTA